MSIEQKNTISLKIPFVLVLILAGAFAARLIYWWFLIYPSLELSGDALFYHDAANSIAKSLSYSHGGVLTAEKAPVYPVFAGMVLKVFGDDKAVIFFQYLLGILSSLPIFWIARNYLNKNKSSLIVLAYLIYPTSWYWESSFLSEPLYVLLNNLFLFYMHRYMIKNNYLDLAFASFWGAASFLTRSSAIFPLGVVFIVLICQKSIKDAINFASIWCVVFLFVLSPWIIRNYMIFEKFIPASNSAGVTLYTSYVNWGYDMSIVNILPEDKIALADFNNEYLANKFLMKRTFEFLKENPFKIISLIPFKIKDYIHPFNGRWYPLSLGSKFNIFYGLLVCFALIGYWENRKKSLPILKLSLAFIIGAFISVLIFHGEIRYRFVLNPILFLIGGLYFANRFSKEKKKVVTSVIISNICFWIIGMSIP
jgi:hypothetical protein